MNSARSEIRHLVYLVKYEYDDFEQKKHCLFVEHCKYFDDVIAYMNRINEENKMLDNEFYSCRSNPKIVIKMGSIPHSKFLTLKSIKDE